MRNTEQLIGSLGYFAHNIGSLDELNSALASYGPEVSQTFKRVKVKSKPGQPTETTRNNIKVASFTGLETTFIYYNFFDIDNYIYTADFVREY